MSGKIVIGKHTLESLTSGMYSDPYVVFREYIQNSVDSIDIAIQKKVLKSGEDQILVQLLPAENKITIKDNGMGISCQEAEKILISIGNSKKKTENSRGFRGIGRLSALSYCQKLIFTTTYQGEDRATRIIFDAGKLAGLLSESSDNDVTVVEVLQKVYIVETIQEEKELHYFWVQMEGVDENTGLNVCEDVIDYLSQNTPVPYAPDFVWGREIDNRLCREGYCIQSYNISVQYGTQTLPIYKPYKDEVLVDKGKNIFDRIQDINIIKIPHSNGELVAIGWISKTNYLGSIYDRTVKGIRLRKGNIMIGDHQTLNVVFKDARFNGWSMGEIFAVDKQLIPNARRDNFEKNHVYFVLFEQLTSLSASITKEIRSASLKRNVELTKVMEQFDKVSKQAIDVVNARVDTTKKGAVVQKLKTVREAVANSGANESVDDNFQIAFEELDILIGKLKGATSYKALNMIDKLSNTEKKILERVFNVINGLKIDSGDMVIEAIINEFSDENL